MIGLLRWIGRVLGRGQATPVAAPGGGSRGRKAPTRRGPARPGPAADRQAVRAKRAPASAPGWPGLEIRGQLPPTLTAPMLVAALPGLVPTFVVPGGGVRFELQAGAHRGHAVVRREAATGVHLVITFERGKAVLDLHDVALRDAVRGALAAGADQVTSRVMRTAVRKLAADLDPARAAARGPA